MTQSDNRSLSTQICHLRETIETIREEAAIHNDPPRFTRAVLSPLRKKLRILLKQERALRVSHGRP
jgi:hypothetical protein